MPRIIKKERLTAMYEAIVSLRTVEECQRFFEDLCSATELSAMEQRYAVAELLMQDRVYLDILQKTNASTSTISRVKRALYGSTGGLAEAMERVRNQAEHAEEKS